MGCVGWIAACFLGGGGVGGSWLWVLAVRGAVGVRWERAWEFTGCWRLGACDPESGRFEGTRVSGGLPLAGCLRRCGGVLGESL